MKENALKTISAVLVTAMFAACSSMTPGENAATFGSVFGVLAGGAAAAAGVDTGTAIGIGAAAGALAAATAYIVSKHQATEQQRRIAEQRAKAKINGLSASQKKALANKKYIAVETTKSEGTKAAGTYMICDKNTGKPINNTAFDTKSKLASNKATKFDTVEAVVL